MARVITTVAELRPFLVPHADIVDGKLCGIDVSKRAARLTPDEVATLNEWGAENMETATVMMDDAIAKEFLGAREVDASSEPYVFKLGKPPVHYATDRNGHNRAFSAGRIGNGSKEGYVFDILNGLWTLGDPGIVGADGIIQSLQHRAIGRLQASALSETPLPPMPIVVIFNVPPQFGDNLDKAKQRDPKDREFRDSTQFTDALVEAVLVEPPAPSDLPKRKLEWAKDLVTVSNWVYCRLHGTNVQATKAKLPSERDRLAMLADNFSEYQSTGCDELQALIVRVNEESRTQDGKKAGWTKYLSPTIVATGIVLASNVENEDSDTILVDWDIADRTLQGLVESGDEGTTGFSPAFADIAKAKKRIKSAGGSAPRADELFGCFVQAHTSFLADGTTPEKVWQGSYERKKAAKDKTYRIYGGLDCGYQEEEKSDD